MNGAVEGDKLLFRARIPIVSLFPVGFVIGVTTVRRWPAEVKPVGGLWKMFSCQAHRDVIRTALELIRTGRDREPLGVEDELAEWMGQDT